MRILILGRSPPLSSTLPGCGWGDPDFDSDAASLDLHASYRAARRSYEGIAFADACGESEEPAPRCFVPAGHARVDLAQGLGAELVFTRQRVYSLRYDLSIVDSNSYGQSLVRQRLESALSSELFSDFFLTVRATFRLNLFGDPLLLARDVQSQSFLSIDDENRNEVSVHLLRGLWEGWAAEARYSRYSAEFSRDELDFSRQTAYLGLLWRAASGP